MPARQAAVRLQARNRALGDRSTNARRRHTHPRLPQLLLGHKALQEPTLTCARMQNLQQDLCALRAMCAVHQPQLLLDVAAASIYRASPQEMVVRPACLQVRQQCQPAESAHMSALVLSRC